MHIVADENIPSVEEAFCSLGEVSTCNGRQLSRADVGDADVLLVRSVTRVDEALLAGSPVRFVASATAGLNHVDLDYLARANIGFANAPGSNAISAAEYVIAAICYWARHEGRSLEGLTVGIIGLGNVGSRVRQRCERLGMRCLANDPPLAERGHAGLTTLEAVLDCDVVTCHVPLEVEGRYPTRQLLNRQALARLRPGALLINASRGEVVDEGALLRRMREQGDISVVLDVWEHEPAIDVEMLRHCLLGTAHIAGYSTDAKVRGTEMIYQACCRFFGKPPAWSMNDVDFPVARRDVELRVGGPEVCASVLDAYDIEADSRRLGRLLSDPKLEPAYWFDHLRKHYPIRREFTPELIE